MNLKVLIVRVYARMRYFVTCATSYINLAVPATGVANVMIVVFILGNEIPAGWTSFVPMNTRTIGSYPKLCVIVQVDEEDV